MASSTPRTIKAPQTTDSSTLPMIKHITFNHSFSLPVDEPLSKDEETLNTHLVRRKLYADPHKKTIKCKTKGQSILLQKVVAPRKHTSQVKTPTPKKRARIIENIRTSVAGTSKDAEDIQLAVELNRLPTICRHRIYKRARLKQKIKLTGEQTLAMKEELGMCWRQGRNHGKLLKKIGVQLQNEKSIRKLSRNVVYDFVEIGEKTFIDAQGVEFQGTFGRIKDLTRLVDHLLNLYAQKNKLTWHNKIIPHNEIWVKIGGDHGKNSLKLTLQIANLDRPNSQLNSVVIALASVKDSYTNIVRFLEGGSGDELVALHSHAWQEKTIKIFLNGDYDFLCKVYGLSGPQGTFPCLWCLMSRQEMHLHSTNTQLRSLDSLISDNLSFMQDNADKKSAAKYNNSLHAPILSIQLDRVSPPYLHILLGIVLKHYKLLENAAHLLDTKITTLADSHLTDLGKLVKQYEGQWQQAQSLQEQLDFQYGCLVLSDRDEDKEIYRKQVEDTEHKLSQLRHTFSTTIRTNSIFTRQHSKQSSHNTTGIP
ncbi:amine oxidase [Plakobranchus ocellatus]|uniref:Amine oxidase n=1 Tax=Plakobranchus ocellatus TaxID=259542 RepID=A0AAV4AMC6_9GAST|nr:amine oxidase [Plakobranchus ocellatus]